MARKASSKRASSKRHAPRFGGRATAVGVGYESQVAAFIATKMLGGDGCLLWEGIDGGEIIAITMQDAESVDDVVVTLRGEHQTKIYISAKHRAGKIAITRKSPAFTEVVASFVRQFHQLATTQRTGSRFMWAVPSSAGSGMTQTLRKVLNAFRADASVNMKDFLRRRPAKEAEAMKLLVKQMNRDWKTIAKKTPEEGALTELIGMIYVEVFDFGSGLQHQDTAEETIRGSLALKPNDSRKIWEKLELHFNRANRQGLRSTAASLRHTLAFTGLKLKITPGFADDIGLLQRITARNLDRLKDHTLLRFAQTEIHINRTAELVAMIAAAKQGHLLVTGEPGCGKSGLIHPLTEALIKDGFPVVLLLAEEVFGRDWKASANIPGLAHAIDDVLAHWPDGAKGVLITDALDAVRDVDTQRLLRRLLQDVQQGSAGWSVVASVREFDLKHGRELRESFPGIGVPGYSSSEFSGVSHFHVTGLAETNLDELGAKIPDIGPFIASARNNIRAGGIHRSPFFLRLASELLRNGVSALRLADWSSPAILLRRFWKSRVLDGSGASHRKIALQSLCRQMTEFRSMALSTQEVSLDAPGIDAIDDLRSRGILQSPILRQGSPTGEDQLRFSHHLLHDYAIARSLIPTVSDRFSEYAMRNPLLPVFYRQSFLFALEELWDGPDGRDGFWACALQMESVAQLHGITRILAPILASRRIATFADLLPLFTAIQSASNGDSPAEKALRHMSSGLQDADDATVRSGGGAWCVLAAKLSVLLPERPSLETPLAHILARLNAISSSLPIADLRELNLGARNMLAHHVAKEVANGWRHAASVAIEALCRTFKVVPLEAEAALLSLLTPQRLIHFPHWELFDFANQLKHLSEEGRIVILRLYEAAFSAEPKSGEWQDFGGAIMPMSMQTSDNWNSIRYSLATYYEYRNGNDVSLMTDIACIAWNAIVRRRREQRGKGVVVMASFHFRGIAGNLIEDHDHIYRGSGGNAESQILSRFKALLNEWAAAGEEVNLGAALDRFISKNHTSLMWKIFMEVGAKYPFTLGRTLEPMLTEPLFFTHPDYRFGGILLFKSLHSVGDIEQRERLEKLILDLPLIARLADGESRQPIPNRLVHAQNKLLGSLDEAHIALAEVRALRIQRSEHSALPENRESSSFTFTSRNISDEEFIESQGISLKDPVNAKFFRLREGLKIFDDNLTADVIEQNWFRIVSGVRTLRQRNSKNIEMERDVWGRLVGACEKITQHADWSSNDARWKTLRRILLKASTDPSPIAGEESEAEENGNYGWPAPRLDAASGLVHLCDHLGRADALTKKALLKLCRDKSSALRCNMGQRLFVLERSESELMWQLMDKFILHEDKFFVLEAIVTSLNELIYASPHEAKSRLSRIAKRAIKHAPDQDHIHKQLATVHLFHFLKTGDEESNTFVSDLINDCDSIRASIAIGSQLHTCRSGGWLTAGDAVKVVESEETARRRTWSIFGRLLSSAQSKLQQHREHWRQLHSLGQSENSNLQSVQEAINRTSHLIDDIAMQLYFASGAFAHRQSQDKDNLTETQKKRFWKESSDLFRALAAEIHPHTAHHIVETLFHLLPCAPHDVFLIATNAIISSSAAGYQYDPIAVGDVVKFVQRALADHREIFKGSDVNESECLAALLNVLDLFVEAGWAQARQLTQRLEEIYR
ncbi:hypothetical protein [Prosthecobacter sp.]|uniref:hypothetical protein n=1 Tax=Prosthecobacter sp. TaxID=1965333 RepID=UPI0037831593